MHPLRRTLLAVPETLRSVRLNSTALPERVTTAMRVKVKVKVKVKKG
jgi:hypothetical protein